MLYERTQGLAVLQCLLTNAAQRALRCVVCMFLCPFYTALQGSCACLVHVQLRRQVLSYVVRLEHRATNYNCAQHAHKLQAVVYAFVVIRYLKSCQHVKAHAMLI
jgi:hypothetical protein